MKIPSEIKILIGVLLLIISVFIVIPTVYELFFRREPPRYRGACRANLRALYFTIEGYGEKYGTLPSTIPSDEEWAQPFSIGFEDPSDIRRWKKLLNCPTIDKRELARISPWQSSYRMNPAVLGAKWEEIKGRKIPLLIETRPNHDGRFHVLYTNGEIELTDKQPELRERQEDAWKKQEQPSQEK
jgi:hypothetical protein